MQTQIKFFQILRKKSSRRRGFLFYVLFLFLILSTDCAFVVEETYSPWQMDASETFRLYPIVHQENVILPSRCNDQDCLKAVNMKTGQTMWEWIDTSKILQKSYYNLSHYIFEDILALPIAEHLIAIDLTNGKTLWHDKKKFSGESFLEGVGGQAARSYTDQDSKSCFIFLIDMQTGGMKMIKRFKLPDEEKLFVRTPHLVQADHPKDTVCVTSIISFKPKENTTNELVFWKLRDTSFQMKMSIYPDNKLGHGVTKPAVLDDSIAYWVANNDLIAINLLTQTELWRTKMKEGMLTSRLAQNQENLFYAGEDAFLYAIDKEDGKIIWKCPVSGTSSRVFLNQEQIYLVGGGDGQLYVIDQKTGQLLNKYKIPEYDLTKGIYLRRTMYANSKIILLNDGMYWYCCPLSPDYSFSFSNMTS